MATIQLAECPVCKSQKLSYYLTAKDYTVSQEEFEIFQCQNCSFRFTQAIPNQSSIGKYYDSDDYISHSDTKEGFINRLYHFARNYMLSSKRKLVDKHHTGSASKNLLDIGTGTGYFMNMMKEAGWKTQGIETDEGARDSAIKNFDLDIREDAALFNFTPKGFDVISMWHVLEHVHRLDDYMTQIHQLLKDTGIFIIAVPNCASHDAQKYGQHWAAWDVPRHLYHFTPATMEVLAKRFNFEIIDKRLMPFDSFYVSMLSEKYKNGKGNLLGGAWHGGISLLKAMKDVNQSSSVIYILKKN